MKYALALLLLFLATALSAVSAQPDPAAEAQKFAAPYKEQEAPKTDLYSSDHAGFKGAKIASITGQGYELKIEKTSEHEVQTLYYNGEQFEATTIDNTATGYTVTKYHENKLAFIQTYNFDGDLLGEDRYTIDGQSSLLTQKLEYNYAGKKLYAVIARDANGKEIGRLSYTYQTSGALREVKASGSYGASIIGSSTLRGGFSYISNFNRALSKGLYLASYTVDGDIKHEEIRIGSSAIWYIDYEYSKAGELSASTEFDQASGEQIETSFKDNLAVAIKINNKKTGVKRITRSYDAQKRVVLEIEKAQGTSTQHRYSYTAREGEYSEKILINDELTSITNYKADGSMTKELYNAAGLYLRITSRDKKTLKEEYFRGKKLVRVKIYDDKDTGAA